MEISWCSSVENCSWYEEQSSGIFRTWAFYPLQLTRETWCLCWAKTWYSLGIFFINASINKLFRSFISAICWIYIVHARNLCDLVFSVIVVTINFNYPTLNRVTLLRYEFTTQFLWWCDAGSLLNELRRAIIIYINVVSQFIISIFKWVSRNFN